MNMKMHAQHERTQPQLVDVSEMIKCLHSSFGLYQINTIS